MTIRLTIWNEGRHEKRDAPVAKIYPDGMDGAIAAGLKGRDFAIATWPGANCPRATWSASG